LIPALAGTKNWYKLALFSHQKWLKSAIFHVSGGS
jgi:hypothetical protein